VAIEDCRHVSARLERALLAAGERVIRVAAGMPGQTRKVSREAGKSDPIDARAVALAVVRDGVQSFPVAFTDEHAMEIRILSDYRDQIICERTRMINRLRWHLVTIAPELEAQLGPASLRGPRICARLTRQLARLTPSPQLRVAKALLKRITAIVAEERELFRELTALLEAHAPQLLAQPGCGTVTAAIIIGRTAGAQRFRTDGHFARHAGTAPIPASSGNTQRHRLHRGGDRQLNRAIHIIALSRAKTDPETRAYLARKHAEGKTKLEAIRCLKRHLARRIWRLLYATPRPPPTPCSSIPKTSKYRHSLDIGAAVAALRPPAAKASRGSGSSRRDAEGPEPRADDWRAGVQEVECRPRALLVIRVVRTKRRVADAARQACVFDPRPDQSALSRARADLSIDGVSCRIRGRLRERGLLKTHP
jgi:transposase